MKLEIYDYIVKNVNHDFATILYYYINSSDKLSMFFKQLKVDNIEIEAMGGFGQVYLLTIDGMCRIYFNSFLKVQEYCDCKEYDKDYNEFLGCNGIDCDWYAPQLFINTPFFEDRYEWEGSERNFLQSKLLLNQLMYERRQNTDKDN